MRNGTRNKVAARGAPGAASRLSHAGHAHGGATLTAFQQRVYTAVRAIPEGRVASYGGIAAILGQPRAARAVGGALCALGEDSGVPWWRVVNRNGEISISCMLHGPAVQRALLRREGVRFGRLGRIAWTRFGWDGEGVPAGVREDDALNAAPVRGRSRL